MTSRILFFSTLFFLCLTGWSQAFDPRIEETTLAVGGSNRKGYLTRFDVSAKKLEKAWWRYCREFGRPLNMKGYYQVTIPSELNSGNVNLNLLSKSMANKNGSAFFLTLDKSGVPESKQDSYYQQVKLIMQSFKVSFAVDQLEEKLEDLEKDAKKTSKKVAKSDGASRKRYLTQLRTIEAQISTVKDQLMQVNNAY
ncbi:hypothetical protein [Marinoscillum sp.]|uniref:hypothetical protein n=1 Tax=Marinoscillum sp. TaxID=2024838 RepID=UPI003BACA1B4